MVTPADTLRFLPQGTDEWVALTKGENRLFEITASIAPNIVGVGPDSPLMQWKVDCGFPKPPDRFLAELLAKGTEDEDKVVDRFVEWWYREINRPIVVFKTGTWQHPLYPWLAASPDRYIYDTEFQEVYLLEAKSRQDDRSAQEPPDSHFVQCQLQLACIPEAKGLFYVSANVRSEYCDVPTVICAVARNKEFVDKEVIPRLQRHRELVAERIPPKKQTRKPQFLDYRAVSVKRYFP